VTEAARITIVYDNTSLEPELIPDWGFSCLVEAHGKRILFDTGAKGEILLHNMGHLGIDPADLDGVFISHSHFDHTGGLPEVLSGRSIPVYLPASITVPTGKSNFVTIQEPVEIHPGIFSTGELARIEQSLVVRFKRGLVVITGCSHPGVGAILKQASRLGSVAALVGGLHGFKEFELLESLKWICPAHCSKYTEELRNHFPGKVIGAGAGKILWFPE